MSAGDWINPVPPCTADAGDGSTKELIANLAEALHVFHDHVVAGPWTSCTLQACRRAQEATKVQVTLDVPLEFAEGLDAQGEPVLPASLAVEGKRVGSVVGYLGPSDDADSLRVVVNLEWEHRGFVGAAQMGLLEGIKVAQP